MAFQQHPAFHQAFTSPEQLTIALLTAGIDSSSARQLAQMTAQAIANLNHGDLHKWLDAIGSLPALTHQQKHNGDAIDHQVSDGPEATTEAGYTVSYNINQDAITVELRQSESATGNRHTDHEAEQTCVKDALLALRPWRKGPYTIADTFIDTEWRSDWKWQRVAPHITPLTGRTVLDVWCGNGYHAWRMRGAGAAVVMGIDPSPLFMLQFSALQYFINDSQVQLLPVTLEALPDRLHVFDTVFSMGVLYHRRQHHEHLCELNDTLRDGCEFILETLILPGAGLDMLEPAQSTTANGRYARMRNVWSLPTESLLHQWLLDSGFTNIRTVDITMTTIEEQRSTDWMPFESLQNALNPDDPELTVEGWPAPTRIIVIANKHAK